jgi:SAM-dependent methyltransferase
MGTLLDKHRETYEELWALPIYQGSPSAAFSAGLPIFMSIVNARCEGYGTILDAGCGNGLVGQQLKAIGFTVTGCDIHQNPPDGLDRYVSTPLWDNLARAIGGWVDYVFCGEVLEHIPQEFTMLAVQRMLDVARKGVFLVISHSPDAMGVWVGETLHVTVQSFPWWKERLAELATVKDARDLCGISTFLLEPRKVGC